MLGEGTAFNLVVALPPGRTRPPGSQLLGGLTSLGICPSLALLFLPPPSSPQSGTGSAVLSPSGPSELPSRPVPSVSPAQSCEAGARGPGADVEWGLQRQRPRENEGRVSCYRPLWGSQGGAALVSSPGTSCTNGERPSARDWAQVALPSLVRDPTHTQSTCLLLLPAPCPVPQPSRWVPWGLTQTWPQLGQKAEAKHGRGAHFSWPPTPGCGADESWCIFSLPSQTEEGCILVPSVLLCWERSWWGWSSNYQKPVPCP